MVFDHGGCGESGGNGGGGGGGGSCALISSTTLLSEPIDELLSVKAMVEAEIAKAGREAARVKSEQVTLLDGNARSNSGGSSDVEGDHHDDGSSEDSEKKTSEVTEEGVTVAVPPINVKEEEPGVVDDVDGADRYYAAVNGSSSSSLIEFPKPVEGLHEVGPPPFLKKTFEMVENPETDPIVSWSEERDSFVVWDSHEFSKILLPKYFKHSNFSSFIRQLNTYGFRKVDPDRWEFANEGFQGGKKHLLKNIRRRSKYSKLHQGAFNSMKPGLEDEVEKLKKDQNILKVEILKLRQQQESSHVWLANVEDRIQCAELKQHQMLFFLTKLARKPTLFQQLIQKIKQKRELDGGNICKRRRLLGTQCPVSSPKAMDTTPCVDYRHQGREELVTLQSELKGFMSEAMKTSRTERPALSPLEDELCSPIQGIRAHASRATAHDVSSAYNDMSETLMRENSVVDEELDVNDSNIYLELEDLINKAADWGGSASELVGQTGCI